MMSSRTDTRESRRAFLRRLTGCLLGAVGTSAVGLAFWDRHGPGPGNDSPALAALRDY
ncbi:MAG: DUF362 domain-containing protein, partial [Desulfatitalea sp.]|nr:DUF362 domain-containing protein [Desulfatitalea sp.]